jgi:hypothetical protein
VAGLEHRLAWADDSDGDYEIYFAHVNGAGAMTGPAVRVTNDAVASFEPSLVHAPGIGFALAWREGGTGSSEIHFALLCP